MSGEKEVELALVVGQNGANLNWLSELSLISSSAVQVVSDVRLVNWETPSSANIVIINHEDFPGFIESCLEGSNFNLVSFLIINAPKDIDLEVKALDVGIRGYLCNRDVKSKLKRCVEQIINGELWFSRQAMSRAVKNSFRLKRVANDKANYHNALAIECDVVLTPKEQKVLKLLITGAKNTEIADKLFISHHTVKTHVYNIFRKTESRNRVEVIAWVNKHIPSFIIDQAATAH